MRRATTDDVLPVNLLLKGAGWRGARELPSSRLAMKVAENVGY